MNPTDQQVEAIALFRLGLTLRIEAGAGTGKTSTLEQMAASTLRVGQYCAFNRDIVHDAALRMPETVGCATAHSLAFRQVGRKYAHRLDSPRMKSAEVARRLDLRHLVCRYGSESKVLQPGYLAGLVQRTIVRFCQTADEAPTTDHVPYVDGIDPPNADGSRGWKNNDRVRAHVAPALAKCWTDIVDPGGGLRFNHDHYLKIWQLGIHGRCRIPGDFILFDEAQDASPVMLDALMQQDAQLVVVGDSQQQIYEWRGAINALAQVPSEATAYLSRSFRFGPEIADVANLVLEKLGAELRLEGAGGPSSVAAIVAKPDCVLTRTNAEAVTTVLRYQADGVRVHLVGGGEEVASFAKGVASLEETGWTSHPELACFDSWQEVRDYCVAPTTNLLTSDLRWQWAGTLAPGDVLMGFDEECASGNGGRQYRESIVESVERLRLPCRRVWASDGTEVVASDEHRWLVKSGMSLRWKRTDMLRPGDEIASVGSLAYDESREAGWLAGIFDGEGWLERRNLGVAQKKGRVLDRIRTGLDERGFSYNEREADNGVVHLTIRGYASERLRLLAALRPERLVAKAPDAWKGMRVEARERAVVQGIEAVGEREVVAIRTSSRTFIAEGCLSHNCTQDPQGGELKLLVKLVVEFGVETILKALDHMPSQETAQVIVSTAHRSKGREWARVQLAGDFPPLPDSAGEWRLAYVAATRAARVLDLRACAPLALLLDPDPDEQRLPIALPGPGHVGDLDEDGHRAW